MKNFKEWQKKYYPNESQETLHKMSHAWAAAHCYVTISDSIGSFGEPPNNTVEDRQAHAWVCKGCEMKVHSDSGLCPACNTPAT